MSIGAGPVGVGEKVWEDDELGTLRERESGLMQLGEEEDEGNEARSLGVGGTRPGSAGAESERSGRRSRDGGMLVDGILKRTEVRTVVDEHEEV